MPLIFVRDQSDSQNLIRSALIALVRLTVTPIFEDLTKYENVNRFDDSLIGRARGMQMQPVHPRVIMAPAQAGQN